MKILIVDDIAANRKVLRIVFESDGIAVEEAPDGVAALAALAHGGFDAVISDILMPRMDGYRLFREIRRQPALAHLPIVAYTSTYLSREDETHALHSGATRYLQKPTPAPVLLRTMRELAGAPAVAPMAPLPDEPSVTAEYSAVLVRKLEEKSHELRARNEELHRANLDLTTSRARFQNIIASAMDAIITIDDAQRIVLFNTAAEAMFGATEAAMLGQPLADLLPERLRTAHSAHIAGFAATGVTTRRMGALGSISGRRKNGEEFPIEASISQMEVDGGKYSTVILRDISARRRAEEQLQLATEQFRALAARSESIREHERTSIAREIHDVLAQELTRLKLDLVWLAKHAGPGAGAAATEAFGARLTDAIAQTDTAIATVQRIATDLRPIILDSLGLPAAVEWQVEDFAQRTGLVCRVSAPRGDSALPPAIATAVFRILQESLTNIARYAEAREVEVMLAEEPHVVALSVSDDGRGITPEQIANPRSIGLVGMRERAQAFDGQLEIRGTPGRGTTILVRIPLSPVSPPSASR